MNIPIKSFYYSDLSAGAFRTKILIDQLIENDDKINLITVITTKLNKYKEYQIKAKDHSSVDKLNMHRVNIPKIESRKIQQIIFHIIFLLKTFFLIR